MTKFTTPAEAYDATHDETVRIPERFPNPPVTGSTATLPRTVLISGLIDDVSVIPDAQSLTLSQPFDSSATITLTENNFHSVSGICLISLNTSVTLSKGASLTLALDNHNFNMPLAADTSIQLMLIMTINANKLAFEPVIISKTNTAVN